VADLKRRDARKLGIAGLQTRDQLAAFIAQREEFIERGIIARRDETAVAREQRKFGRKRAR
jgi:hypothetical protein